MISEVSSFSHVHINLFVLPCACGMMRSVTLALCVVGLHVMGSTAPSDFCTSGDDPVQCSVMHGLFDDLRFRSKPLPNWGNSSETYCSWGTSESVQVDCARPHAITTLTFYEGLTGTMPTEIGLLKTLTTFYSYAGLSGTIPATLSELSNLTELGFSPPVGGITKGITGTIPQSLSKLKKLTHLKLSFLRNLQGSIPPQLGQLPKLEWLQISDCDNLEGSIPTTIGMLSSLKFVLIFNNLHLQGTLPTVLTTQPHLQHSTDMRSARSWACSQMRKFCHCSTCPRSPAQSPTPSQG